MHTTNTRTLPIRVAPLDGEALDSWLEAQARRYRISFGATAHLYAIQPHPGYGWMVRLSEQQFDLIAFKTGIDRVRASTLLVSHLRGRALEVDDRGQVDSSFPWSDVGASRYCPQCLAETGGRWQLSWRLRWSFACTVHHCLLADTCPVCERRQRTRTPWKSQVPRPGACTAGARTEPCPGDLTAATPFVLASDHPLINTQRQIDLITANGQADFGLYGHRPQSARQILTDIALLAARVRHHIRINQLADAPAEQLLASYAESRPTLPAIWPLQPLLGAPSTAAETAVTLGASLNILESRSAAEAATKMDWLYPTAACAAQSLCAGRPTWLMASSSLIAACAKVAGSKRTPIADMRRDYSLRISSAAPVNQITPECLARRIPTMLWQSWTVRIQPIGSHSSATREHLSVRTLLAATQLSCADAVGLLCGTLTTGAIASAIKALSQDPHWPAISEAIARLADYLCTRDPIIDYARRRGLDYSDLLTEASWRRLCRDVEMLPGGSLTHEAVRHVLFEKISGLPAEMLAYGECVKHPYTFRQQIKNFPLVATPQLAEALWDEGRLFLARRRIDEPLTYDPPLFLLEGLDVPSADIDHINIAMLHRLADQIPWPSTLASLLCTDTDAIRYLLEEHPVATRGSDHNSLHATKNRWQRTIGP